MAAQRRLRGVRDRGGAVKILAAVVVSAIACTGAAASSAPSVDLLHSFKSQLAQIKRTTTVPVLLPAALPILTRHKVYASGGGDKNGWDLELAFAPKCGSATACFLASFTAERGKNLPGKANARLAGGDAALFRKSTCGASCAPASLWFVHDGVLYGWQHADVTVKAAKPLLIRLANEAVSAGPR